MTDELQQASSQQESPLEPQVFTPLPVQPQKSKKNFWIFVGAVLVILCLCSIACVAIFGASIFKAYKEKGPVESVLDDTMRSMVNKDAEGAYALFSPRAQRQIPLSTVQQMLEGNYYYLYEGYQSLTVSNINISAVVNINPDVPQGTVADVTGVIHYEDGIQGSFNSTLEKVDGNWMIDSIYITVPPDKIK